MDLPFNYLHIKNMLNLTLFGDLNADENFRKYKYISIRPDYIDYYQEFKKEVLLDNKFLKYHIKQYLSIVSKHEKLEIVRILNDNIELAYAAYLLQTINQAKNNRITTDLDFESEVKLYLDSLESVPTFLTIFFQQHFLNFAHVRIEDYKNHKLNREEYFSLLNKYLHPQTEVF
jgi:hypothetical protein